MDPIIFPMPPIHATARGGGGGSFPVPAGPKGGVRRGRGVENGVRGREEAGEGGAVSTVTSVSRLRFVVHACVYSSVVRAYPCRGLPSGAIGQPKRNCRVRHPSQYSGETVCWVRNDVAVACEGWSRGVMVHTLRTRGLRICWGRHHASHVYIQRMCWLAPCWFLPAGVMHVVLLVSCMRAVGFFVFCLGGGARPSQYLRCISNNVELASLRTAATAEYDTPKQSHSLTYLKRQDRSALCRQRYGYGWWVQPPGLHSWCSSPRVVAFPRGGPAHDM